MHETMNVPSATASGSSPNTMRRRLIYDPDYLTSIAQGGILFIQVTLNTGRTLNVSEPSMPEWRALLKEESNIRPEDVLINLIEMRSFDNSEAQIRIRIATR